MDILNFRINYIRNISRFNPEMLIMFFKENHIPTLIHAKQLKRLGLNLESNSTRHRFKKQSMKFWILLKRSKKINR
jgi:hypothetical protein